MAKSNNEITFTNWVTINGIPVKVSELPVRFQQALGNRVRSEPFKALGFLVIVHGESTDNPTSQEDIVPR